MIPTTTITTTRKRIKEPTQHPLGDLSPCPVFFSDILGLGLEVICKHPSHNNNNNNSKGGLVTSQDHPEDTDPTTSNWIPIEVDEIVG